uniref:Uncharacterized protein n=1 Tax=Anguilla anguilla TaxID=7936 RepID=A0A0E9PYM5_ANGAN
MSHLFAPDENFRSDHELTKAS